MQMIVSVLEFSIQLADVVLPLENLRLRSSDVGSGGLSCMSATRDGGVRGMSLVELRANLTATIFNLPFQCRLIRERLSECILIRPVVDGKE